VKKEISTPTRLAAEHLHVDADDYIRKLLMTREASEKSKLSLPPDLAEKIEASFSLHP
jgi:hypothetical protein